MSDAQIQKPDLNDKKIQKAYKNPKLSSKKISWVISS